MGERRFETFFEKAFWGLIAVICSTAVGLSGFVGKQFNKLTESVLELNGTMSALSEQMKAKTATDERQDRELEKMRDQLSNHKR